MIKRKVTEYEVVTDGLDVLISNYDDNYIIIGQPHDHRDDRILVRKGQDLTDLIDVLVEIGNGV